MNIDLMIETLREMLWISILLSLPILGSALIVGLAVGLLQAVTSIQEQTLSFIPKLLAMVLVLVVMGSWMTRLLVGYCAEIFSGLPRFAAM
ncbi:MAG TPA: flagellar biosynthesis protein FliQ [Planctomycetota bacterium]|nr:flagellar biosynthesis protein FliQ [Planctomycetota bacterium]